MRLNFISGLPRSGTTLLSAILRQNAHIHAGITTALASMILFNLNLMSPKNEFFYDFDAKRRKAVLEGLAKSFYADINYEYVFDTNRMWAGAQAIIREVFPESKIIVCVRAIEEIVGSFQSIYERNPLEPSGIYNYESKLNIFQRTNILMGPEGPIGMALGNLRDLCNNNFSQSNVLMVRYDSLVGEPDNTLSIIYDFIGIAHFKHNFSQVNFSTDIYDRRIGVPGLHSISGGVRPKVRHSSLPHEIHAAVSKLTFWEDPAFKMSGIRII